MRIWLIVVLSAVVGSLSGLVLARTEFAGVVEYFEPMSRVPTAATNQVRPQATGPRAIVEGGTKFTFDTIAQGATAEHAFVVRNDGDQLLKLEFDHPSCGMCIEVDDKHKEIGIPPGQSADVVVKYSAKKAGESLNEAAYFKTNDPLLSLLRFDIVGIVTQAAKVVPSELTLGTLSASEGASTQLKLLGFRDPKIELLGHEFSDPATAQYFEISTEPLSPEEVRAADKHATCGLLATVKIKSQMPLGSLSQTITFQARTDGGEHNLEVPVSGEVVGDISIFGYGYVAEHDALMLGANKVGAGRKLTFHLLVKGPHRHDVKFSVAELDPADALQVAIGKGEPIGDGRVIKHPITVELLKEAPAMNRMGNAQGEAGKLVIQTTHPTASKIALQLRFVVE